MVYNNNIALVLNDLESAIMLPLVWTESYK